MATKTIDAREARIKTAAVEIKALTVAGKQVTLSVFRQLKHEQIIDPETLTLRGTTWGTVNYFWGEEAKRDNLLHVVWQSGDELRRSIVPALLIDLPYWRKREEMLQDYFRAAVMHAAIEGHELSGFPEYGGLYYGEAEGRVVRAWIDTYGRVRNALASLIAMNKMEADKTREEDFELLADDLWEAGVYLTVEEGAIMWRGPISDAQVDKIRGLQDVGIDWLRRNSQQYDRRTQQGIDSIREQRREQRQEDTNTLYAEANSIYGSCSFAEASEHTTAIAREMNDAEAKWKPLRASLESLDQLFIAV